MNGTPSSHESLQPQMTAAEKSAVSARIVAAARRHLMVEGYAALTMDLLAQELGMSKKTLYVHFAGKEALVSGVIDALGVEIRTRMQAVVERDGLGFVDKLCGVIDVAASIMGRMNPATLRQLQRSAPELYQKIDDLRLRTIPLIFGRIVREGVAAGLVRSDIDASFLVEFWLQAIRGLVHPESLDRTQLSLQQTLEKAIAVFFGGILTEAGRTEYAARFAARRAAS